MSEKDPKKQSLFNLRESLRHQLQKTAEKEGTSMADVVRRALDLYFKRREWEVEERKEILDSIDRIGDLFTTQKKINQSFEASLEKLENQSEGIEEIESLKERVENHD